jgi:hypothetical protein
LTRRLVSPPNWAEEVMGKKRVQIGATDMPWALSESMRNGPTSAWVVFASLIGIVGCMCAGCDGQTGGGAQRPGAATGAASVAQRQFDEYDRQLAVSQRQQEQMEWQLAETGRQLEESARNLQEMAAHSQQLDELLKRWSSQTERVDALLLRWENLADAMEQRCKAQP